MYNVYKIGVCIQQILFVTTALLLLLQLYFLHKCGCLIAGALETIVLIVRCRLVRLVFQQCQRPAVTGFNREPKQNRSGQLLASYLNVSAFNFFVPGRLEIILQLKKSLPNQDRRNLLRKAYVGQQVVSYKINCQLFQFLICWHQIRHISP